MSITKKSIATLEKAIGYSFKNTDLLLQALVHPSYANEHQPGVDNQRMEFLGDAVLDLLTAEYVYHNVPGGNEGILTVLRSQCVSGQALAEFAEKLGIGGLLQFSSGIDVENQRCTRRTLAAAFEAVVGAAWLDGGITACRAIFVRIMIPAIGKLKNDVFAGNPKGKLQAVCQKAHADQPVYTLVSHDGPDHLSTFTVKVVALDHEAEGTDSSKRAAEAAAADKLLSIIDEEGFVS